MCKLQNTEVRVICKGIRETDRETETDRVTDRQTETERHRDRERDREMYYVSKFLVKATDSVQNESTCYQQRFTQRDLLYYVNKFPVRATDSVQNTEMRVISQGLEERPTSCTM